MYRPLAFLRKWAGLGQQHLEDGGGTARDLDDDQIRAVYAAASWLIDYPDEDLRSKLPVIGELVSQAKLPAAVERDLLETIDFLREADPIDTCAEYVETFDTRKRGCLFLTYFANGDTRRRGAALIDIKSAYRAAGLEMDDSQLPDHLTYVLEFAAGYDLPVGVRILLNNRAGLELLRLHLTESTSPWGGVVRAVCATLTPIDGDDIQAVERLAAEGPAQEQVGLDDGDGYGQIPPSSPPTMGTPGQPHDRGESAFIPLNDLADDLGGVQR